MIPFLVDNRINLYYFGGVTRTSLKSHVLGRYMDGHGWGKGLIYMAFTDLKSRIIN